MPNQSKLSNFLSLPQNRIVMDYFGKLEKKLDYLYGPFYIYKVIERNVKEV